MKIKLAAIAVAMFTVPASPAMPLSSGHAAFALAQPVATARAYVSTPEAAARKGSKRAGGKNSKGKGSKYVGGRQGNE
jgi:hypothetical protein